AGGAIVVFAGADGRPRAGRRPTPPADVGEERARRLEHLALAHKLNLVLAPGVGPPTALPLTPEQVAFLARFALTDAGAVWFREMADDTLRLFNQGYLAYDEALWTAKRAAGEPVRLSELLTGGLSEAGLFAQDASLFRIYAHDGRGAMAAHSSIRLGLEGIRCQFTFSDELVDPYGVLSHEFGHTRYGDARSAGTVRGEAATVARYENPVRQRNGYPPRTVYYLRLDPRTPVQPRDELLNRLLAQWRQGSVRIESLAPVERLYCECMQPESIIRDCTAGAPIQAECSLRWLAVRVVLPEPD
ncbi:MAG: hypothetical protein ACK4TK_11120, partial [Thiobacillaceae bacterium]